MGRNFVKIGENNGKIFVEQISQDRPYRAYDCTCTVCGKCFTCNAADIHTYADSGCAACRKEIRDAKRIQEAVEKYEGKQLGGLTVMRIEGIRSHYGHETVMAECRCGKCGKTFSAPLLRVKTGQKKECSECSQKNLEAGHRISTMSSKGGSSIQSVNPGRATNRNSSTGIRGVAPYGKTGKYRAYIHFRKKQYHLGIFDSMEEAVEARKEAEKKIYGEFEKWYRENYPGEWEEFRGKKIK